jgi:hypothetical protein
MLLVGKCAIMNMMTKYQKMQKERKKEYKSIIPLIVSK